MACQPREESSLAVIPTLEQIEARIQCRLGGHVRDFRVRQRGHGLVLEGHAQTYYAKQLAQHAVMEVSELPILANEIYVA